MFENLEQLIKTIRERKNSSPDKSYTSKLLNDKNLSVSKVKEEIAELIESVDKRMNKILARKEAGKSYSQKNLDELQKLQADLIANEKANTYAPVVTQTQKQYFSGGGGNQGGNIEGSVSRGGTDDTPGTPFRRGGIVSL